MFPLHETEAKLFHIKKNTLYLFEIIPILENILR